MEEARPNDGLCFIGFPGYGGGDDTPAFRHMRSGNWGFADAHVENRKPRDVGFGDVSRYDLTATNVDNVQIARLFHLRSDK